MKTPRTITEAFEAGQLRAEGDFKTKAHIGTLLVQLALNRNLGLQTAIKMGNKRICRLSEGERWQIMALLDPLSKLKKAT